MDRFDLIKVDMTKEDVMKVLELTFLGKDELLREGLIAAKGIAKAKIDLGMTPFQAFAYVSKKVVGITTEE